MLSGIEGLELQLAKVPTRLERAHIEAAVDRFMATYPVVDVEDRVSLVADDVVLEDPVGLVCASSKAELRQFLRDTVGSGVSLWFFPVTRVVVGDEAIQLARLVVRGGETRPMELQVFLHFVFDDAGLISRLRTFYDRGSAREPVAGGAPEA